MKFDLDYKNLDSELNQPKYFKYSEVKDRLVKVAFDVVRFKDADNIDGLWQIQQTDDGEVIVATYDDGQAEVKKSSVKTAWDARSNKAGTVVTVFYKEEPVTKIATEQFGISTDETDLVCSYLPTKLASDNNMKNLLLNQLSNHERQELLEKYPELTEGSA